MPQSAARFVVLCQPRTGSSLLGSLLAAHPQIYWDGEHLLDLQRARGVTGWLGHFMRRHPLVYLRYRARRMGRPVYGCKLTLDYCRRPEDLVRSLQRRGWLIVHLTRRDLFQGTLSACVAERQQHFRSYERSQELAAPIRIEPDYFLAMLARRVRSNDREARLLADLPHLDVAYEDDLAPLAARDTTIERLFGAIGLTPVPVQSSLKKTWNRPYAELVENYAEVVDLYGASQRAW
jgi:LPS sulfotransferase NodH